MVISNHRRWRGAAIHRQVAHQTDFAIPKGPRQPARQTCHRRRIGRRIANVWRDLHVEEQLQTMGTSGTKYNRLPADGQLARRCRTAFGKQKMDLREWLPILEAGLSGLTIGVIPPALDQVVVGTIDRSRNPELKLAIVLGMNEGVFPATPKSSRLLSEAERDALSREEFCSAEILANCSVANVSSLTSPAPALASDSSLPLTTRRSRRHAQSVRVHYALAGVVSKTADRNCGNTVMARC